MIHSSGTPAALQNSARAGLIANSEIRTVAAMVAGDKVTEIQGFITAQNRKEYSGGFVFLKGKVYGVGEVYLGRVTGPNSRVIFSDMYLQDHQPGRVDQLRLPRQHRQRVARRVQLHWAGRRRVQARAVVAATHQGRGGQVPHRRLHQRQGVAAGVLLLIVLMSDRIHVYSVLPC
jgi:hypothetical protein